MRNQSFRQVRAGDVLSLGGFSTVRRGPWRRYLQATLWQIYPGYALRALWGRHPRGGTPATKTGSRGTGVSPERFGAAQPWHTNDCVLIALDQYLFSRFGVVVPEDNLFKVYNPRGEGILPARMLEAISAVIEPLGYEIDRVMAPDPELRQGLGESHRTVGLEDANAFEGQPGVAMINLANGYSHAFFWQAMEASKFTKEQFRLAVLIKPRRGEAEHQTLSVLAALKAYCDLLGKSDENPAALGLAMGLLRDLETWLHNRQAGLANEPEDCLREAALRRLAEIQALVAGDELHLAGQVLQRAVGEFAQIG